MANENKTESRTFFPVDSVEYRDIWTRNIVGLKLSPEERAALDHSKSLIPTLTANAIWDRVSDADLLNKVDVTWFPHYVRYPIETTNNAATAQAVGASLSPSADVIDSIVLNPVEYAKTVSVGADFAYMATEEIHEWLVNSLAGKIKEIINADILIGAGVVPLNDKYELKGIATSVDASDTPFPAEVTLASLLSVMKSLGKIYQKGAVWIMSPDMFFENVLSISGIGPYIAADGFDYRLIGHDVVLMEEAAISEKENIFYGNPNAYKVNFFSDITMKPFENINSTLINWKASVPVNGQLLDTSAFVRFAQT